MTSQYHHSLLDDYPTGLNMTSSLDRHDFGMLVCPVTKSRLTYLEGQQELVSTSAGLAYPIRDGIAIMLVDEARKLTSDELAKLR